MTLMYLQLPLFVVGRHGPQGPKPFAMQRLCMWFSSEEKATPLFSQMKNSVRDLELVKLDTWEQTLRVARGLQAEGAQDQAFDPQVKEFKTAPFVNFIKTIEDIIENGGDAGVAEN